MPALATLLATPVHEILGDHGPPDRAEDADVFP